MTFCCKRVQSRDLLTACYGPDWYEVPAVQPENDGNAVVKPQQGHINQENNTHLCGKHEDRPEHKQAFKSHALSVHKEPYQKLGQGRGGCRTMRHAAQ